MLLIWTNLNRYNTRMLWANNGWHWPSGSGEDFKFHQYIYSLIRYYLPLKKSVAFHLNKLESLHPWMLCAKCGWNRPSASAAEDFLFSSMYFCYFSLSPLWKRRGEFPSPRDIMCLVWLKLAHRFWRRFFQFRQCIFAIL